MKIRSVLIVIAVTISIFAQAQWPGGGNGMGKGMNMNLGHFYGKVVDSVSGKPIEYAAVQLYGNKFDTASKTSKYTVITGCISKGNGDFSLENLPVFGQFDLKIKAIGYLDIEQKLKFNIDFQKLMKSKGQNNNSNSDNPMSGVSGAINAIDVDLGNLKMHPNTKMLNEVVIKDEMPDVEIKLDKKIYNVEKNLTTTGGTGEDVLKTIPAVTVDMDGNVSMRNAAPQIFVDGRPTTLTIDQIPADAIQSIEVISNPSAKYDASGGMAGIINIVLKKNRKTGYNGTVRAGVDQRGKLNGGGDFNVREQKINFFISAFGNQRKSLSTSNTVRQNLLGNPLTTLTQADPSISDGFFGFGRIGFDWFINNRNTFTLSQNFGIGQFRSTDVLSTKVDSLFPAGITNSKNERNSVSDRVFKNMGSSLLFKHLFPKEGREWTADVNYNSNNYSSIGDYSTQYYDLSGNDALLVKQKQNGGGGSSFLTSQSDFTTPMKNNTKLEAGVRASIKNYNSSSKSSVLNPLTGLYMDLNAFGVNYTFSDQVYAGYATFSQEIKKFTYQIGLRAESSIYSGAFKDSTTKYFYQYPLIPFPSLFVTYHINDKNDLQLSYSRRINRPNFFQLIPATDFSDSLNVRRGNPDLKPEFTNSVELNYLHTFDRSNTFMISGYYKYSTALITNYQLLEFNSTLNKNVIVTTYENALTANSYGAELTSKNSIKKWLDFTTNVNLYYTIIDASNVTAGLINKRFNWFAKMNATIKFPKNMSLQLSAEYTAKSNMSMSSGGGGRWGGMGGGGGMGGMGGGGYMFGGSSATAQGYTNPIYVFDAGFKYEFLKEKKGSLTLNVSDFLKTRQVQTHSESSYFIQDATRKRDQLFFRLTFSLRFGKFDVSIFKRKNMKMNTDGIQDMGM